MCPGLRPVRVIMALGTLTTHDPTTLLRRRHLVLYHLSVVFDHICIVYVISVTSGMLHFIVRESSVLETYCGIANEMPARYKFAVVV